MMKKIWSLLIAIYIIVYAYSAYKIQFNQDPTNKWALICTLAIIMAALIALTQYAKNVETQKQDDEHRGQISEDGKS